MNTETICVHAGTYEDEITRGINTPIFTSSACGYLDSEERPYPRYFNLPNQQAVVRKLCALETAEDGVLFSSGMAAVSTVLLALLKTGDHVILQDDLYGGTHAFVTAAFGRLGIDHTFVATSPEAVAAALTPRTALIFVETPTNPLLSIMDIRGLAAVARAHGALTVMDNTFASPVNQNPLTLGMDVVIHSGTKYLGGHSDLCCGAALADRALTARIRTTATQLGGSLNAEMCYLLERSLKTLSLRVERQNANAEGLARFLAAHPRVVRVYYPGLEDHPGHTTARSQMKGFGGMLSFEVAEGQVSAEAFLRALQLIRPALSLGGVESTICQPAATSHQKLTPEERRRVGIADGLLRLSVGIEHLADLEADLAQALER